MYGPFYHVSCYMRFLQRCCWSLKIVPLDLMPVCLLERPLLELPITRKLRCWLQAPCYPFDRVMRRRTLAKFEEWSMSRNKRVDEDPLLFCHLGIHEKACVRKQIIGQAHQLSSILTRRIQPHNARTIS